jgi:DNA mismatch repair protein MutS2
MKAREKRDAAGLMGEETLRVLEFEKIRLLLAQFTITVPGREQAMALAPLGTAEEAARSLAEVSEMAELLASSGRPPVGGVRDLGETLRHLRAEGTWLSPDALLDVLSSMDAAAECKRWFAGRERAPLLGERSGGLVDCRRMRQELRAAIGPRGEILDGASFELGEIRRDIQQHRARIKRALEEMLGAEHLAGVFQDRIITERGGRYVVPVRADHRGRVKGFIHDESASGQTLFVEPAAVLEWNNELQTLLREEKREEERILRRLSEGVRRESAILEKNQQLLAVLDFQGAAGTFSRLSGGAAPHLSETPVMDLRDARHPLLLFHGDGSLRREPAIPIDIRLGEENDTLVISGPNTGGKTVALKTAGLLLLMVRAGLHIPCHPDSRIHLFPKVFADIGDEQSIEANLSTFSGHLTRIGRILKEADGDSLVLLDEAGTGTDPAEGGALALAVIDYLRNRGTRVILTTHLNLIKGYAHLRPGVENAAVEFDSRTLAPTFRLHYGIPGASNAFTIAGRLGIPAEVLTSAGEYLGEGERRGLDIIEDLNRLRKELERQLGEGRVLRDEAQRERNRRRQLLVEVEDEKKRILDQAARRGDLLVHETERHLRKIRENADTISGPREIARQKGELREIRDSIARFRPEVHRQGQIPQEVRKGEILRILPLGVDGEVVRVSSGEAELVVHGKKTRLPLAKLEQYSPRRFAGKTAERKGAVHSRVERQGFSPRLVLIGQRAEEALLHLDRFLDDALLHGCTEVEIVHGAGEGILRRAVREFLAGHRQVTVCRPGEPGQGGDNVTLARIREE